MAKSWMNTLKGYFSLLNQLNIEGDISELALYHDDPKMTLKEKDRILRQRDDLRERNVKPLKCKTTIRNIQIISEEKGKLTLLVHSYLWKLFQIKEHFLEEEDEEFHRLVLCGRGGEWFIESDLIYGEEESRSIEPVLFEFPEVDGDLNNLPPTGSYNRAKVKRYAELWWNLYNPSYPKFEVDCTNFASQCLAAGGFPMENTGVRTKGWWISGKVNWSFSWSVAHSLMLYLTGSNTTKKRAELKTSADQLQVGDVICYDWDGNGSYQHNTVVIGKDPNGMPLVNAHTTNSRHRYWEYRDSYAWTPKTQYKFIHVLD